MLKKIAIFIRSDGWANTLRLISNTILSHLGRTSTTIGIYRSAEQLPFTLPDGMELRALARSEELEALHFDRLSLTPYRRWFDAGSMCFVLLEGDRPIGFGWNHFGSHRVDRFGNVDLGGDKAWLGPYFVLHSHRGHGYQKLLIAASLNNLPDGMRYAVTSVNSRNAASLKSFEKLGFVSALAVVYQKGQSTINYLQSQAKEIIKLVPPSKE